MSQLYQYLDIMNRPADLISQLSALPALAGVVLIAVGAACVFNGYRWHRWIMVVLALLLGYGLGQMLSSELGRSSVIAMALGVLLAAIATPMLKFTVAFFAGVAGAVIGGTLWAMFKADQPELAWAGAGMGFIALALMSFIFFRIVVILFTSVGGGAMLVLGSIALLLQLDTTQSVVKEQLLAHTSVVSILVLATAAIGFVTQEGRARGDAVASSDEE